MFKNVKSNATSVSEILPKKANKANANSGDRHASTPTMGEDTGLEPKPAEAQAAEANSGDSRLQNPPWGLLPVLNLKQQM